MNRDEGRHHLSHVYDCLPLTAGAQRGRGAIYNMNRDEGRHHLSHVYDWSPPQGCAAQRARGAISVIITPSCRHSLLGGGTAA